MAMYGQGKTRGQVSILEIAAATTQNAAALQPSDRVAPDFLWQYLRSQYERLRGAGAEGHISHLNLGYVRGFMIPLASLPEQTEIASQLDIVDSLQSSAVARASLLADLFRTLLHQLMTAQMRIDDLDLSAQRIEDAVLA